MNRIKQCPNCSTMLRFPVTQGTILVQCPVCSHRFTFDPDLELDVKNISPEEEIPTFQFKPSFQNYRDLFLDLLYAPIDYLKSKQNKTKKEIPWIPILLFTILLLYVWKWSLTNSEILPISQPKEPILEDQSPMEIPSPDLEGPLMETPEADPSPPNFQKPSFEI
ncbi:zinc-ribbon domain-containing protein [Leptospira bouyouniensis]|nr:zinc-ribbon domain-containing protein [Leptospira bouyouniensis]